MNVLIVEDERSLSHEMEIYLTRQNFNCDVAFNGKSASDKINATNYDFILLDLGLPDMDGLELLKESKKQRSFLRLRTLSDFLSQRGFSQPSQEGLVSRTKRFLFIIIKI
jgi:DNA-binding response OmpR family regulator